MEWFKFYHNKWLTDCKILSLSLVDRLCFITLLCVASRERESASRASQNVTKHRDGAIFDYDEWQIIKLTQLEPDVKNPEHCPVEKSIGFTERLIQMGLLERIDDTTIAVKNFGKLQDRALSDAERARNYRLRKKDVDTVDSERHEPSRTVTTPVTLDKEKIKRKNNNISSLVSDDDRRLTQLLIDLIKKNNPDWRMKGNVETWAKEIEKLHRIDERSYQQIEYMIRWTQQDTFWQQNILSTTKLREKFEDLIPKLKADALKKMKTNKPKSL
jgi:hypothetical protein